MKASTISMLYQDHHLLLVNKPAGLVIHPTYKHASGTMWDALLLHLAEQGGDDWQPPVLPDEPAWAGAPEQVREMLRAKRTERWWKEEGLLPRPCLVHRLDKDTSGVVALARTERARRHLIRQFHEHTIVKRYLTVVRRGAPDWARSRASFTVMRLSQGEPDGLLAHPYMLAGEGELLLDGPLQRDPDERRRCIVGPEGQPSSTIVKVLAHEGELLLLEARPVTGRTHQIRAHLAALGYSIVGDQTYALPPANGTPESALHRQFLHAHSLTLRRYPDDILCTFVAPLADDLSNWMEHYFPAGLSAISHLHALPSEL